MCSQASAATNRQWYPTTEAALNTIFALSSQPDTACTSIIRKLATPTLLIKDGTVSVRGLSRVLFVVGHVAMKQLVYVEEFTSQLKKQADVKAKTRKIPKDGEEGALDNELGLSAAMQDGEARLAFSAC